MIDGDCFGYENENTHARTTDGALEVCVIRLGSAAFKEGSIFVGSKLDGVGRQEWRQTRYFFANGSGILYQEHINVILLFSWQHSDDILPRPVLNRVLR